MGLVLIFSLERLVFIPRYRVEIEADVDLITQIINQNPLILESPRNSQAFIDKFANDKPWRLMLLDVSGTILASNDVSGENRVGTRIENPALTQVLEEQEIILTDYSRSLSSEVIDIWRLIKKGTGQPIGIARISQPLESIADELMQLRSVVSFTLLASLAAGTLIGLGLAISLERPIQRITASFRSMAWDVKPSPLEIQGPKELQLLAEAFNHLVDRIHEIEAQQKKLLANLVHELGRPIGALRSSIQALNQGAVEDVVLREELFSGMDFQTRSLERLLNDLTNLYDTAAGKFELKRERVNLSVWLHETLAPWKTYAEEKDIRFNVESEVLPSLWIDPLRLDQALGNLVSNAIKFTPKHGQIRILAQVDKEQVLIHVEDSGPGLSDEDRHQLFTPFYRGKQRTRFPQGMGLGLSIARDIVISHGGTLEASDVPDGGSRFTIRLPTIHPKSES
jgi:two-component system sensor histidine kinase BaeS